MRNTPIEGKIILLPLHEMVGESELIIIGKVLVVEKTNNKHKEYGDEYKATVGVEKTIKGDSLIKDFDIYYFPDLSVEPELSLNQRCVFFIKIWEGKYTLVQGYGGKVIIENDEVRPSYIKEEEIPQKLQIFIQKIKKLIK
jgi:hypothetical protein